MVLWELVFAIIPVIVLFLYEIGQFSREVSSRPTIIPGPLPAYDNDARAGTLADAIVTTIVQSSTATTDITAELAKRARFVRFHATGKIDIVGRTAEHTFMRYHLAAEKADIGKSMTFRADPVAR